MTAPACRPAWRIGEAEDFVIEGSLRQGFSVRYLDAGGRTLYAVDGFTSYPDAYTHASRTFMPPPGLEPDGSRRSGR